MTVTVRAWLSARPPAPGPGVFAFCKTGEPDPKSVRKGLLTLSVQQRKESTALKRKSSLNQSFFKQFRYNLHTIVFSL